MVCNEHKFCLGHVPDSPKEIMPSKSSIAPMSFYTRDGQTSNTLGGNSFAKLKDANNAVNQSGMMAAISDSQHELQIQGSDDGILTDENNTRVMQVSFNLNNNYGSGNR